MFSSSSHEHSFFGGEFGFKSSSSVSVHANLLALEAFAEGHVGGWGKFRFVEPMTGINILWFEGMVSTVQGPNRGRG